MTDEELIRQLHQRQQDIRLSPEGLMSKEAQAEYRSVTSALDGLSDPTSPVQVDQARALAKRLLGIQDP